MDPAVRNAIFDATGEKSAMMMDMYKKYWHPFGMLLTDMEKEGMSVNRFATPLPPPAAACMQNNCRCVLAVSQCN